MTRTLAGSLAVCLMLAVSARADDAESPLTPERRAELIEKWHATYKGRMAELQERIDKARVLLSNPKTAAQGKRDLADAEAAVASLRKDPFKAGFSWKITDTTKEGSVGRLASPTVVVVGAGEGGTLVDMAFNKAVGAQVSGGKVIGGGTQPAVARLLLVPAVTGAKPKAKLAQPGLWYVAGTKTIDGKPVQVLHRIELKPEDMPAKK